jgi:hypothetical protein
LIAESVKGAQSPEISWNASNTINVSKMDEHSRRELNDMIDAQLHGEEIPEPSEDFSGPKIKKDGPVKFPSQFDFKGRVVFISNLKKEEFDSAIMSRSAKINMDLSPEEVLVRMRSVLSHLGGDDVAIEKKEELIDQLVLMNKNGELAEVTMREFVKGMNILRSGVENWRDLLQYA